MRVVLVVLAALCLSLSAFAFDGVPGALGTSPAQPRQYPAPPLRAATTTAAVVASLDAASADDLAAVRRWNDGGNLPVRIGVVRDLNAAQVRVGGLSAMSSAPVKNWRGAVTVAGSDRIRLKLTNVRLGDDTILWVYGTSGAALGFDSSLLNDGVLWTPSVDGPTITLEVASVTETSFTIAAAADIRRPAEVIAQGTECMVDAACEPTILQVASATAHLQYVSNNSPVICSGALIIDAASKFPPHLLTANHCISTAAEASTLEAYWDYRAAFCGGPPPALNTRPRSSGSQVLVTSAPSDVTLLKLNSVPGPRWYLGWTPDAVPAGASLYRVSHPYGWSQGYSVSIVETVGSACSGWPRPQRIYSNRWLGATAGGSSGSPTFTGDGRVVGQLTGGCGTNLSDPCSGLNRTVDGAFSVSYPLLKPFINPDTPPACTACQANANTACMLNGRFKVTMTWRDPSANLSGNGRLITYNENRPITSPNNGEISQVSFWSMYPNDTTSVEALVRMIRGGSSFWIFTTGFAAAEYTVTVQDTQKCTTWTRTSPFGATAKIADYNALPF